MGSDEKDSTPESAAERAAEKVRDQIGAARLRRLIEKLAESENADFLVQVLVAGFLAVCAAVRAPQAEPSVYELELDQVLAGLDEVDHET